MTESNISHDLELVQHLLAKFPDRKCDYYKIIKLLYFADLEHISQYARKMTDDFYAAMKHGPVLSNLYDRIKDWKNNKNLNDNFSIDGNIIHLKSNDFAYNYVSESELDCLEYSYQNFKDLNFDELHNLSSDYAYKMAIERKDKFLKMSIYDMAMVKNATPGFIDLIKELEENKSLTFA